MKTPDISPVNRILKQAFLKRRAPVVDLVEAQTEDPFCVLVATILSARTKDETTAAVCERLFRAVTKPHDFDRLSHRELEKLIFPIGFFRTKARHLKRLPKALDRLFGSRIPEDIDDLCKLPGVGRKTANLVRAVAFDKPAVCVDVHVHRISNRLGLVKTRTPFETERALRRVLPQRYWKRWNSYLVSHGQSICAPRNPKCGMCPIFWYCSRVGLASVAPRVMAAKRAPTESRAAAGRRRR